MTNHRILRVQYEIQSQARAGSFTVPADVCGLIGVDKGDMVWVEVESASGRHGPARKQLISDRQPQPVGEMSTWMRGGERITVTVWPDRP